MIEHGDDFSKMPQRASSNCNQKRSLIPLIFFPTEWKNAFDFVLGNKAEWHARTYTHTQRGVTYAVIYLLSGLSSLSHNILEDRSVDAWNHTFFNIILSSAPVYYTPSLHFNLIQRYFQYRFLRHSFICYYRSYECTVKSVQMV